MDKETLLKAVLASDELPTLPTVASKLISLTSKEDTTLADIADLVSQDMALSSADPQGFQLSLLQFSAEDRFNQTGCIDSRDQRRS